MGPRTDPSRAARAFLALLAAGAAGCGPTLLGTCQTQADCAPSKTYCSAQGVCIAQSGNCNPSCGPGTICSNSSCVALKPSISLQPGSTRALAPGQVSAVVRIEAGPGLVLGALAVRAADSAGREASGTLAQPVAGDNLVLLSGPGAGALDPDTFAATLETAPDRP